MLSNQVEGQRGRLAEQVNVSDADTGDVSDVGEGERRDRNAVSVDGSQQARLALGTEAELELSRYVVLVHQLTEVHTDGTFL